MATPLLTISGEAKSLPKIAPILSVIVKDLECYRPDPIEQIPSSGKSPNGIDAWGLYRGNPI